jgi:very-short-patch-repair endonuclease
VEKNLVFELDGGIHKLKAADDAVRDAVLRTLGHRVLRIRNEDLIRDLPAALVLIRNALRGADK